MWKYHIFNNPKILHYAVIIDEISGISLKIPYEQLSHMTSKGAEKIVKDITNKLNS